MVIQVGIPNWKRSTEHKFADRNKPDVTATWQRIQKSNVMLLKTFLELNGENVVLFPQQNKCAQILLLHSAPQF